MVACVFGLSIRVYAKEEIFRTLRGHSSPILTLAQHPYNSMQLVSLDRSGCVITWDLLTGEVVCEMSAGISDAVFGQLGSENLVVASLSSEGKGNIGRAVISVFTWTDSRLSETPSKQFSCRFFSPLAEQAFCVGQEDSHLAVVTGPLSIDVVDLDTQESSSVSISQPSLPARAAITAVALHPSVPTLAAGLSSGQIAVWRYRERRKRRLDASPEPLCSRLHWHALAVSCLAFSASGNFLLSGGHEAVLVRWDLTDAGASTSRRQILPRLGAPLAAVGALSHDCVFAILSSRILLLLAPGSGLDLEQRITGRILRGLPDSLLGPACPHHPPGLVWDCERSELVAGALAGHLQWLGRRERVLDVTVENYVALAPKKVGSGLPTGSCASEVTQAAFSRDGRFLATLETMALGDSERQVRRLKLWRRGEEWELSQCLNLSHHAPLACLHFSHDNQTLVTSGGGVVLVLTQPHDQRWREAALCRLHDSGPVLAALRPSGAPLLVAAAAHSLELWWWGAGALLQPRRRWRGQTEPLRDLGWAGETAFARTEAGKVSLWRLGDEGMEEETLWQSGASAVAASRRVLAAFGRRDCLLFDVEAGQEIRRVAIAETVCCGLVTPDGLVVGLSAESKDGFVRLRSDGIEEKEEEDRSLKLSTAPMSGLMGKLEALAKPLDLREGDEEHRTQQQRMRVSELAAARIKETLDEFIRCPAFCSPDLSEVASNVLQLHMSAC